MIFDYFIEFGIMLYDIIDIYKNRQVERQCEYYGMVGVVVVNCIVY